MSRLPRFRLLLIVIPLTGMGCSHRPLPLTELQRAETLWRGPEGVVARYTRPASYSIDRDQDVIVCEKASDKFVIRALPLDSVAVVEGNTLAIYEQKRGSRPGWYNIKKNHLSWFQRTFGNQVIGEIRAAEPPNAVRFPEKADGKVFVYRDGTLSKIAEENTISELWDVPVEGLVYVAFPGLGVTYSAVLPGPCH